MKTSWFIGVVLIYLLLNILSGFAEQQNLLGTTQVTTIQTLLQPVMTDDFNILNAVWSYISNFGEYFNLLISISTSSATD